MMGKKQKEQRSLMFRRFIFPKNTNKTDKYDFSLLRHATLYGIEYV